MLKEVEIQDIATDKGVRSAFSAIKKDIAAIHKRLCLLEQCQYCKEFSAIHDHSKNDARRYGKWKLKLRK